MRHLVLVTLLPACGMTYTPPDGNVCITSELAPEKLEAVHQGMRDWEHQSRGRISLTTDGDGCDADLAEVPVPGHGGYTDTFNNGDIPVIRLDFSTWPQADWPTLAAHELGHAMGAHHEDAQRGDLMYEFVSGRVLPNRNDLDQVLGQ